MNKAESQKEKPRPEADGKIDKGEAEKKGQ